MDARQLHKCLEYIAGGSCEVYVISKDYIRDVLFYGRTLVAAVNTETSDKDNGHWVVFFIYYSSDGVVSEYYDPLGKRPSDYLIDNPYPIVKSNYGVAHQDTNSKLCSLFVAYFIYLRIIRPPYQRVLSFFSKDKVTNDNKVFHFYKSIEENVKRMKDSSTVCRKFGCFPKSSDKFKRRFEF